jgi:hypothetical protein
MRTYLTKSFQREAKDDGISDDDCLEAIAKADRGLIDADLGGGLIKQRIPRGNRGAAKGSRAVIFYKHGTVSVFLHVFPKSRKASLSKSELVQYQNAAKELAKLGDDDFGALSIRRGWRKISK